MPRLFRTLVLLLTTLLLTTPTLAASPGDEETMNRCAHNLETIGKAIKAYQSDHHQLPAQLSDLYPKYVPDKATFHCPADSTEGSTARDFLHKDPKMPMSYTYEFSADQSHGLPCPLGPFPKADVGDAWGTCRQVGFRQAEFFGDQVPVVRCFHHKDEYSEESKVLNLTLAGRVYHSRSQWEDHPDSVKHVYQTATDQLLADPENFPKHWHLGRLQEYGFGKCDDVPEYRSLRPVFKKFADALASQCPRLPKDNQWFASRMAVNLYKGAGDYETAMTMLRQSIRLAVAQGVFAPDKIDGRQSAEQLEGMAQLASSVQQGLDHPEDALLLHLLSHRGEPRNNFYVRKIAELHGAMNGGPYTEAWKDVADPTRTLLNKQAPDFTVHTPAGQPLTLKDARANHKALLLNFFFYGCGACRQESPHLTALYAEFKDKGLGALAVDNGDTPARVNEFVDKFDLHLPVAIVKAADDHSDIFSKYGVQAYPTTYLIDANGKVVWRAVGFDDQTLPALRKVLATLGVQ
jgi:peroxiredoxin